MLFPKSNSRTITVLIHILVWAAFGTVIFFFTPLSWNITVPYQFWVKQFITIALLAIIFYANSFLLVPKFLLKNNNGIYFLIVITLVAIIVIFNNFIDHWLDLPHLMDEAFHKGGPPHKHGRDHGWDVGTIAAMIGTCALVMGVSTSITTIQKWQKDRQLHQEMEQDRVSSELSFLKAQINPHFFFNTLNNIYALTHINVDTSRKAIHQLSRMMRYVLYDTQNSTTMLSQEIDFVKDYISLMQLRLTDVVKINFTTPAVLKDMPVAPMIFLPFIENAFKHGVSAMQPSQINIAIDQAEEQVDLMVDNTIIKEQNTSLEQGSGIGLNNTRRRLHLLYPGKHTLVINENAQENTYSVHLTLNLS